MSSSSHGSYPQILERSFSLHSGLHHPTLSSTGVPEGRPSALPSMNLVTWLVTANVASAGRLVSYVDKWSLLAKSSTTLLGMMDTVFRANESLALLLNPDKTRVFATTKTDRRVLSSATCACFALNPCMMHDDLRVCFRSIRKPCPRAIATRLQDAESKFRRLELMPWQTASKSSIALRVIWPAVSYGVSLASTPVSLISPMRCKMSGAVWGRTHRRNHFLAPLFGTKINYEPFLAVVIRQRISALRRAWCKDSEQCERRWNTARSLGKVGGNFQYIFQDLELLCWIIAESGVVCTPFGHKYNLYLEDWKVLLEALHQSWLAHVAKQLAHKDDFRYLAIVDAGHSVATTAIRARSYDAWLLYYGGGIDDGAQEALSGCLRNTMSLLWCR